MFTQSTHISLLESLARPGEASDYAAAWTEFQGRYGDLIRRFAMRRGLQPADCDDVLQETLMAIGKAMPGFEYDPQRGKFRSYLMTVVANVIFRRLRQNPNAVALPTDGTNGRVPASDDAMEAIWEDEWRRYHLQQAMRTIDAEFNEADRAAFTQYALQGHDAAETAQLLNMSIDQVYQAKSRILKRLSAVIEQQVAEEG